MEKREGNFKILEYTNVHFLICEAGFCFVVLAGLNENGGNWVLWMLTPFDIGRYNKTYTNKP